MTFLRSASVLALLAIVFGGCTQDPLGRHAVSGVVKVDGVPLNGGNISFQPSEGQATSAGAVVMDGRYSIPRESGLVAGKYRVSINAPVPGTGGKADETTLPGDPPPPPKELIPADWNTASTQFVEVKKSGSHHFPFEISTKSGAKSK